MISSKARADTSCAGRVSARASCLSSNIVVPPQGSAHRAQASKQRQALLPLQKTGGVLASTPIQVQFLTFFVRVERGDEQPIRQKIRAQLLANRGFDQALQRAPRPLREASREHHEHELPART